MSQAWGGLAGREVAESDGEPVCSSRVTDDQLLPTGQSIPRGFFVGIRLSTLGSVKARKPKSCNNPLPAGSG